MKKRNLLIGSVGATLMIFSVAIFTNGLFTSVNEPIYSPRKASVSNDDAKGSAQWLHEMRMDPRTGEVDPHAYLQAKNAVNTMRKQEAIGSLEWEELGPDNIGGRTRAFLIDRDDPNILYSGAVSGGLFISTTRGSSWQKINDFQENLAIVSISQAVNGDIYYGTGEGMYYNAGGTGTGGIVGAGIFKKGANETEFTQLASTIPTPNNNSTDWASVGVVLTDLSNANRVWAGTNNGIYISNNGGDTWERIELRTRDNANRSFEWITDGVMDKNGGIWISAGIYGFYSPTGLPGTFTEVTVNRNTAANNELPRSVGRMVFAVSPQDENYVYSVQTTGFSNAPSEFLAAFRTTDGGDNWQRIGQRTASLNPHGRQGGFDHAVTVDAFNKDRILVGGVNFWQWSLQGGWSQVASGSRALRPAGLYVHVDHHRYVYDTTSPGRIYAVNDGGIFRSVDNGQTWAEINNGYNTTQFYGIGFSRDGVVMGGTQDNGTILVDGQGNTPMTGVRTVGIDFRSAIRDGDGGYAEISSFDKNIMVKAMQYGILGRTNNFGESFTEFYNFGRMDRAGEPNRAQDLSPNFAPFVTPFLLWENQFDDKSQDTLNFGANPVEQSLGFGQGARTFTGTVLRPQQSAKFVPGSFVIAGGVDTLTTDTQGNIQGNGSGTFNDATGEFNVTFNNPDGIFTLVSVRCQVFYTEGDTVIVPSRTLDIPITHVLNNNLGPGDQEPIVDKVQSMFFVGLTSRVSNQGINLGGIWMTRKLHDFTTVAPEWIHVAHFGGSPGGPNTTPSALAVTSDGDKLFVGTTAGRLFRISGLSDHRDIMDSDISLFGADSKLEMDEIATFGRFITSIAIDPNNDDRVIVTLGGYGGANNVRFSTNATAASPSFNSRQGNLPAMPVYAAVINSNNPSEVVVGTDFGIFSTENITSGNTNWVADKGGFANVPVFMLRQEINPFGSPNTTDTTFSGLIYAASHGRGMWKTGSLATANALTAKNFGDEVSAEIDNFKIYPNPAGSYTNVRVELDNYSDVQISVRDLSGRVVRHAKYPGIAPGIQDLELNLEGIANGTLIIHVHGNGIDKTQKVIKVQ